MKGGGSLVLSPPMASVDLFGPDSNYQNKKLTFVEVTNPELSSASSYDCLLHQKSLKTAKFLNQATHQIDILLRLALSCFLNW